METPGKCDLNSREARELEQKRLQLAVFTDLGKALTSSLDLKEVLNSVMEKISELLHPKNWSLLLLDESTNELKFEIVVGKGSERIKDLRLKLGEGVAGWVARERKPLLVPDVGKDPRFSKKADEMSNFTTQSIVCVPLVTRGKCLGVIELINKVEYEAGFSEDDLLILTTLADYSAIAIENAIFFNRVQELTITDDLTRLYNSRFLHSRLEYEVERARRFKYDLSMIFFDLDYFKEVNDTHGHLRGSKLLQEIAQLILSMVRNVDMACRYGGDEFIIMMPGTPKKSAVTVAEKLRKMIREHVFLMEEGLNLQLTASFGVASFPEDAATKEDLIHEADNAMYRVKNRTRDGVGEARKEEPEGGMVTK
ncbi:MAG: sensor domain-containing diguanylate cyclase [Deltaproteobacteria bacterium]|nr:sensor domain-containing diguanylate cyclase [Deltaproteobacteria bacterium]MBZ0220548.1 sensor domain-containing diguanylate cyclase [Deltaproteobacteria bacterium]